MTTATNKSNATCDVCSEPVVKVDEEYPGYCSACVRALFELEYLASARLYHTWSDSELAAQERLETAALTELRNNKEAFHLVRQYPWLLNSGFATALFITPRLRAKYEVGEQ